MAVEKVYIYGKELTMNGGNSEPVTYPCDWLGVLSASILNFSIANERARNELTIFLRQLGIEVPPTINTTWSVGGWRSDQYITALDPLIEEASKFENPIVLMHGFGNDITDGGGFPGRYNIYRQRMTECVTRMQAAGIRVLNSSVSYRIPPGSNPPAPYNLNINHVLIKELTPWCWDDEKQLPRYDLYNFTRPWNPRLFEGDNIHPTMAGRQMIRGYTAQVLADVMRGPLPLPSPDDFRGREFLFSFGRNFETVQNGINPVISNEIGEGTTTNQRGAATTFSFIATDGHIVEGPYVQALLHTNVNTDGRAADGDTSTSLKNAELLRNSIFIASGDETGTNPTITVHNLPNGLTGTLSLTASRNTTSTDRKGIYRVIDGAPNDRGEKVLDAAVSPPQVLSWPFIVNSGKIVMDYRNQPGSIYAYANGIKLAFDRDPFRLFEDDGYEGFDVTTITQSANSVGFDFTDVTKMFKDDAGTEPVTRFRDEVRRINSADPDIYLVIDGADGGTNRPAVIEEVRGVPVLRIENTGFRLEGFDPTFARPVFAHGTMNVNDGAWRIPYFYSDASGSYGGRKWGALMRAGRYRTFYNGSGLNDITVDSWQPYHSVVLDRVTNTMTVDGTAATGLATPNDETYSDNDVGFRIGRYPAGTGDEFIGVMTHFIMSDSSLDTDALAEMVAQHRTRLGIA